jgi:hypothetical protein
MAVDGMLVPVLNWRHRTDLFSGKHRRYRMNVSVVADVPVRVLGVSGASQEADTICAAGLTSLGLAAGAALGDSGYQGNLMTTLNRKQPGQVRTESDTKYNSLALSAPPPRVIAAFVQLQTNLRGRYLVTFPAPARLPATALVRGDTPNGPFSVSAVLPAPVAAAPGGSAPSGRAGVEAATDAFGTGAGRGCHRADRLPGHSGGTRPRSTRSSPGRHRRPTRAGSRAA